MNAFPQDSVECISEILSSLDAHISVIDRHGKIVMVNESWEKFAEENGARPTDSLTVGANYLEVCKNSLKAGDQLAGKALKGIQSVLSKKRPAFSMEYPCHSPGQKRWFRMDVNPISQPNLGAVLIHNNISRQKEIEHKLLQYSDALQRVNKELIGDKRQLEHAQAIAKLGSYEWDISTDAVVWSDELYRIFGYEPQSFKVEKGAFLDQVHPDDRERVTTSLKEIRNAKRQTDFLYRIINPKTGLRYLNVNRSVELDENGNVVRVYGSIQDITEQKRTKKKLQLLTADLEKKVGRRTRELAESQARLQKALEKEVELNALKSRFVSMASHEFRTPLTTISSSVNLLKKYTAMGAVNEQEKHFGRIKRSVDNLITILDEYLSLEKVESGEMKAKFQTFDFENYMEDLLSEVEPLAKEKQQIVHKHSGNTTVRLDPNLTRNILLNLLSNALKYSAEDGMVRLITKITNNQLIIEIMDEGIGIPEEDQGRLFTRFFRAGNASKIKGTGLGLNIVKRYLDLLNGKIRFVSKESEGSTFTVTIPL